MKRFGLPALIILIAAFVIYRFFISKPSDKKEEKQAAISFSENSGPFNTSFNNLLSAYYKLKDALVESDTVKANHASIELGKYADSLKIDEIEGDSTGTIKETASFYAKSISSSIGSFAEKTDLEAKRKEFEGLTDAVWTLTRTVKYDGQKVYYQYCPMAFDNKGAYWISNNREILNPYFGNKMLHCGEIADSVDYSHKTAK